MSSLFTFIAVSTYFLLIDCPESLTIVLCARGGLLTVLFAGKKAWQPLVQLDNCHDDRINTVSISPDGEYMVSVAQDDTLNTWQCEEVLNKSNLTPHRRVYFANNNDNRKWLSSLRPVFDPKQPHTFAIGSMEVSRGFNMFTLGGGRTDTRHIKSVINYCDEVCVVYSTIYSRIITSDVLYTTAGKFV